MTKTLLTLWCCVALLVASPISLPVPSAFAMQFVPFPGPGRAPMGCASPTGTTLSESFGDASTSCWTSGPTTCNNTWTIGAGSGHTVVTSAAGAPANSACVNALEIAQSASVEYIYKSQSLPFATPVDVYAYVYITSEGLADSATVPLFGVYTTTPAGATRGIVQFRQGTGANYTLRGGGSTTAITGAISLATWYKVRLHLEAGTDASYVQINDGSNSVFTQNAADGQYVTVGTANSATLTHQIGALWVD